MGHLKALWKCAKCNLFCFCSWCTADFSHWRQTKGSSSSVVTCMYVCCWSWNDTKGRAKNFWALYCTFRASSGPVSLARGHNKNTQTQGDACIISVALTSLIRIQWQSKATRLVSTTCNKQSKAVKLELSGMWHLLSLCACGRVTADLFRNRTEGSKMNRQSEFL